ncbi:thiamine phosphate synthase [Microlunatus sp. Y2014]|uniref:thiamine phosphate synthase n=1 Tax=Microlunatus sp. Y2014 TaxID=3418488 RepID=UPI003DA6D552
MSRRDRLAEWSGVYLVTDTGLCGGPDGVVATAWRAVAAGVRLVQVRDPAATDDDFLALARAVVAALAGTGALVLLNDRVHLVAPAGADGAHVGQGDLAPDAARARLGPDSVLGLSCSSVDEVLVARREWQPGGVIDYLGIGPVWDQRTKPDAGPALGRSGLTAAVAASPWPAVAIGGVGADRLATVREAGAAGAAVVSAICGQPDTGAAAAGLVRAWLTAPAG